MVRYVPDDTQGVVMKEDDEVLCTGTNLDGSRCTRHRTPGTVVCRWHKPEMVEERARKLEEQAAYIRSTVSV